MKKWILIIMISLFLTGCGGNKNIKVNYDNVNSSINESENKDTNDNNLENNNSSGSDVNNQNESVNTNSNSSNNQDTTNKPNNSTNTNTNSSNQNNSSTNNNSNDTINYSNEDKIVISTIEDINDDVDDLLNEGKSEDIKSKAKGVFITLVDFVFYDGEIKGITFDELTDKGKEKVLQLINMIDEKIEKHFPGYKETISEKTKNAFTKASEVIKNGANNIKNFAREKLGEEYYQDIIDAKDDLVYYTKNALSIVGDVASSLFSSIKDKLSNWYENFKNSN